MYHLPKIVSKQNFAGFLVPLSRGKQEVNLKIFFTEEKKKLRGQKKIKGD